VAFNESILRNEDKLALMNADISDFLRGFDPDPEKTMHVVPGIGSRTRGAQPICGQLWEQEWTKNGTSNKAIILSGVEYAVRWPHALEMSPNPRPGLRMIYPRSLSRLATVLTTGNVRMDGEHPELWSTYESVLNELETWPPDSRPLIVREDDPRLEQWSDTAGKYEEWLADAKIIAVGSYRLVLEDGPDVCTSESENEHSDHGEVLEGMYTPDVLGSEGHPVLDRAKMTEDQARGLRERRAGGSGTEGGSGRQET
jgi:hypothetical protein